VGAWLAARFALSRFYREKVWERKTAAYTAIFDALHDMEQWFKENNSALSNERELTADTEKRLSDASTAARTTLRRRLASETWLIPDVIRERIEEALVDLDLAASRNTNDWVEYLIQGHTVIDFLELDLRNSVRRDLRVKRLGVPYFISRRLAHYRRKRRDARPKDAQR
jgi:hypothetical protein